MEEDKKKICDLDIPDISKAILTLCLEPKRIIEIVAKMNKSYNYISTSVAVLVEQGHLRKIKTLAGANVFELNKDRIRL